MNTVTGKRETVEWEIVRDKCKRSVTGYLDNVARRFGEFWGHEAPHSQEILGAAQLEELQLFSIFRWNTEVSAGGAWSRASVGHGLGRR